MNHLLSRGQDNALVRGWRVVSWLVIALLVIDCLMIWASRSSISICVYLIGAVIAGYVGLSREALSNSKKYKNEAFETAVSGPTRSFKCITAVLLLLSIGAFQPWFYFRSFLHVSCAENYLEEKYVSDARFEKISSLPLNVFGKGEANYLFTIGEKEVNVQLSFDGLSCSVNGDDFEEGTAASAVSERVISGLGIQRVNFLRNASSM